MAMFFMFDIAEDLWVIMANYRDNVPWSGVCCNSASDSFYFQVSPSCTTVISTYAIVYTNIVPGNGCILHVIYLYVA